MDGGLLGGVELGLARVSRGSLKVLGSENGLECKIWLKFLNASSLKLGD